MTIRSKIHKVIHAIWNKEDLPEEWKESITVPISKKGDKTDCSNYRDISLLSTTYKFFFQHPVVKVNSISREIIGDHQCGLRSNRSTADHIYSASVKYLRKNGNTIKQFIGYLKCSRKPMSQLGGRSCEMFSLEFGIHVNLVRLKNMSERNLQQQSR